MTEDRRFGGIDRLFGLSGAQHIRRAHVVIVGMGGVGSWAAESLARSGVGRLTFIDLDHVAESNINRQVQATSETLGMAKVIAMPEVRERLSTMGLTVGYMTSAQLASREQAYAKTWARIIRESGFTAQ